MSRLHDNPSTPHHDHHDHLLRSHETLARYAFTHPALPPSLPPALPPTLPPYHPTIPTLRHKPTAVRVPVCAVDPSPSAPLRFAYHSSLFNPTYPSSQSSCLRPSTAQSRRIDMLPPLSRHPSRRMRLECPPHRFVVLLHPPAPSACQSADLTHNDLGARHPSSSSSSPPPSTAATRPLLSWRSDVDSMMHPAHMPDLPR